MSGDLVLDRAVHARAGVNIALIKYWGKAPARGPDEANLPAVPSLALTLDKLGSEATVRFAPDAPADRAVLDGEALGGEALDRVTAVLDAVREAAGVVSRFEVRSENHVPTAAGLASSASGMASIAAAAGRCAGLTDPAVLSAIARRGSGSAARSIFGGWVAWDGPAARPIHPPSHWDVALVVAIVDAGPKAISSRAAMNRTSRTSPFYPAWVEQAGATFDEAMQALERRDLAALVGAMEASTLRMHACALAARPSVRYGSPASLAVVERVEALRADGIACGWTMDAGPNVKVLCERPTRRAVIEALARTPGVRRVIDCLPGVGVNVSLADVEER